MAGSPWAENSYQDVLSRIENEKRPIEAQLR